MQNGMLMNVNARTFSLPFVRVSLYQVRENNSVCTSHTLAATLSNCAMEARQKDV